MQAGNSFSSTSAEQTVPCKKKIHFYCVQKIVNFKCR